MLNYTSKDKPWFIHTPHPIQSVVIIGAGLAGCQSAYALARQGVQVTLIEREADIATQASGNLAGVIYPKFSAYKTAQSTFYTQAFLHATQHIPKLLNTPNTWQACGVLSLNHTEKQTRLHRALINAPTPFWPEDTFKAVSADEASALAGITLNTGGLFFPQAGWVNPKALCHALINAPDARHNITLVTHHQALALTRTHHTWQVSSHSQTLHADAVVIANAQDALAFEQTRTLNIKTIRGQTSYVPAKNNALKTVICHDGYITPAIDGVYSLGASFNLKDNEKKLRQSDHESNLNNIRKHIPKLIDDLNIQAHTLENGRVCFRCQTNDYLPIIGPVANVEQYKKDYALAFKGHRCPALPAGTSHPNLFINVAHGSRGISHTGLGADILACYMLNQPHPVSREVLHAIHPARFVIKEIKRS